MKSQTVLNQEKQSQPDSDTNSENNSTDEEKFAQNTEEVLDKETNNNAAKEVLYVNNEKRKGECNVTLNPEMCVGTWCLALPGTRSGVAQLLCELEPGACGTGAHRLVYS